MDGNLMRFAALVGEENIDILKHSRVALFGVGGVGSAAFEALLRSGVGTIDIFDNDCVNETNLNRQLIALSSTLGLKKTYAAALRARDINKAVTVNCHNVFYCNETANDIDLSVYDYIIDAVDTVSAKIELICRANKLNIPLISVMGTGNKLSADKLCVTDIYKTSYCPLAKVMRYELKRRGVKKQTVIYSTEIPRKPLIENADNTRRTFVASSAFVPAAAGFIAAGEAVKYLIGETKERNSTL